VSDILYNGGTSMNRLSSHLNFFCAYRNQIQQQKVRNGELKSPVNDAWVCWKVSFEGDTSIHFFSFMLTETKYSSEKSKMENWGALLMRHQHW
jgi:hypothetical protein